jgi:superfamily II DNA or RNA helicase
MSTVSTSWEPQPAASLSPECVPRLELFSETVEVEGEDGAPARVLVGMARLSFDYGGVIVAGSDPVEGCDERDLEAEHQARRLLESFGPVEVECVAELHGLFNCQGDYVIDVDCDVNALCTFVSHAVSQLRALGWQVEIEPSFHCEAVDSQEGWYTAAEDRDDLPGWFNLELGVEVGSERVNLLPALLQLLDSGDGRAGLEQLAASSRQFVGLPLGDGRFLPVPPERLRLIVRILLELYDDRAANSSLELPATRLGMVEELDQAFHDRASGVGSAPESRGAPAVTLRAELRPYQREGVAWLQHLRAQDHGGVLADDMGLGKTLQVIAHMVKEKQGGRLDRPVLVAAPTSLIGNWARELARFAPGLKVLTLHGPSRHDHWDDIANADVVLISYGVLLRDLVFLASERFHLMVLDEAQAIKNPRSRIHRVVGAIAARHRLCLSGTPVENSLEELWALFDFLAPGFLGDQAQFRATFRTPIEKDGRDDRLAALRQRVAPFILRRLKSEVAKDLPSKTEVLRPVELTGAQRDLYESIRLAAHEDVRRAVATQGIAASAVDILDALLKLRQVCCDPRLVRMDAARAVRQSAKYELLFEMLEQQLPQGRRALIFSQFATMLRLIGQGLEERGLSFAFLTGATADRQRQVDKFQGGDADVFLISLKAGGTGLNLTRADTVIHYDPWWNPAVQAQATDRAYRIGQENPVFVYNLVVAGSVEERILHLQRNKRELAESILGGGDHRLADLSAEELDGLFAPLDP